MCGGFREELEEGADEEKRGMRKGCWIWRSIRGEEGICILICIYIFVCIQGGRRKGGFGSGMG